MNKVDEALEKEILRLEKNLEYIAPDSEEYKVVSKNLARLLDRRIAMKEAKSNSFWNGARVVGDLAAVGLTTAFYGIWLKRGFAFETNGIYTSKTFANFLSKLKPGK